MSDSSRDVEPVVCRLCTSTEPGQLQIFGEGGKKHELIQKIKGCLFIEIQAKDSLTKSVCQSCVAKVEDFHEFQQTSIRAQSILEKENLKHLTSEDASAEAENIVKRLQAGGSALSITPVNASELKSPGDAEDIFNSPSALSITPIWHNSESSGDDDSQWDSSPPYAPLSHLKSPSAEDYILMQEESFKLDPSIRSLSRPDAIEFNSKHGDRNTVKDTDILGTQFMRRVVLPPMWDVYERSADKENVTHRRYVVSKSSFPCSLCGSCVSFHCQQTHQNKKYESHNQENLQQNISGLKQEPREDRFFTLQEQQNQLEQQILRDLRSPQFPSQDVGMLDCPECGKLFPRRSSWKRHLRTHYEGRAFVCPLCGKGFNRKEHLSRHMISHSGGRPFRCETCFKPFTRKEHLARHLACNTGCGGTSINFLAGMGSEHAMIRPFTCDVCFQTFVRKEHMLRHRKRAHLTDGYIEPQPLLDEDGDRLYSCVICNKAFPHENQLLEHSEQCHQTVGNNTDSTAENQDDIEEDAVESPQQIEVEVSLVEDCSDEDSVIEGGIILPNTDVNGIENNSLTSAKCLDLDVDTEEMKLDKEDLLRIQMNEAMRKVREGSDSPKSQASRCEVCQKSFTRKGHLVRHLRRFHPQVELAYAVAYGLGGNMPENNTPLEESQVQTSFSSIESTREDENEADDESGSTIPSLVPDVSSSISRSKGGQHPCSICGKMFGRRYHLVRHRRTQHGVDTVKAGPVGRPPKRLSFSPQLQSSLLQPFRCTSCGGQFSNQSDYRTHSCSSNNNTIGKLSGSRALAEMAAKISDKLNRGKDSFDHVCQSCGKKFCNKLELDKHVETHVNDLMEGMLWM